MNFDIRKYPLLTKIYSNAKWKDTDGFPSNEIWAENIEKWLFFIYSKGESTRFEPRLIKQNTRQRDKTLAEINVAYFVEKELGFSIVEWEPNGYNNNPGDFLLGGNSVSIYCEVKSPGWESEVVKAPWIDNSRLKKPKYINGEYYVDGDPKPIRRSIDKDYNSFPPDKPTLLIINDDLPTPILDQVEYNGNLDSIYKALYYKPLSFPYEDINPQGCFVSNSYENLSGIMIFNVRLVYGKEKIEYRYKIFQNKYAINKLPESMLK